jgi:hypothetical protein
MPTRVSKMTVIGAAIGLVLAGAAIAPVSAAQPTAVKTVSISTTCSGFNGKTITAPTVSASGIAMRGGDTITAKVSPARDGDRIRVVATMGLNFLVSDGAALTGYTWRAPADGVYNMGWSLTTATTVPTTLTWSFTSTCSATSVTPAPSPTATTKPGKGGNKP